MEDMALVYIRQRNPNGMYVAVPQLHFYLLLGTRVVGRRLRSSNAILTFWLLLPSCFQTEQSNFLSQAYQ